MNPNGNFNQNNERVMYSPKAPMRKIYYQQAQLGGLNNEYQFQSPQNINYRPLYKINSHNYLGRDNILKTEGNNYPYIAQTNKSNKYTRNRIFCNLQTEPNITLTQNDKYYYDFGVVVHKRSANKGMNFNNNSIHFIKRRKIRKFQ